MSQENVEVVRRVIEVTNREDWDTAAAFWDPHIVIRSDASWPEWGCCGREAALRFLKGAKEAWRNQVDLVEIRDLGDRVLCRSRYTIHAALSGVKGERLISEVATFRNGRMILIEFFLDHDDALKAVGLEE